MDLILILALATFVLLIGFLLWNRASVKNQLQAGGSESGLGGPNDPLSGTTEGMRHPDTLRADLDRASGASIPAHPGPVAERPHEMQE